MSQDPAIPLNCPYCRAQLAYERTEGETHFYLCDKCGLLKLPLTVAYAGHHAPRATRAGCEEHPDQPYPHPDETGADCDGAGACQWPLGRAIATLTDAKYRARAQSA